MFDTFNFELVIRLFEILKTFYPPKGAAKAELKVVQLFLLMFYCGLRKVFDTFNFELVIRLFEFLKMFYPPKGVAKAAPMGSTLQSFHLLWYMKGV